MATIGEALARGIATLAAVARPNPALDTRVLLGYALAVDTAMLYAHPERALTTEQEQHFFQLIERRSRGEPVAYLLGHKEFFGLDFVMDARVLIPRPETELLVEAALALIRQRLAGGQIPLVADIGTGSGAIAVTLAALEPRLPYLYATDISAEALEVATLNCQRHGAGQRVRFLQGDLLEPLPEAVDILIANLPYVGTDEMDELAPDVRAYEPHLALFSGASGLNLLYRFLEQARDLGRLKKQAVMMLEIGSAQYNPLLQRISELWPQAPVRLQKDYAGWGRILTVNLT